MRIKRRKLENYKIFANLSRFESILKYSIYLRDLVIEFLSSCELVEW